MKNHANMTTRHRGITLPELIVVISVAIALLAATIPSISAVRRAIQDESGTNAITAAVTAARSHVATGQANLQDMGSLTGPYEGITYQGVAVLFTPAGELRLVQHFQKAKDSDPKLIAPNYNGYRDIPDQEYIELPSDVGVVGIARGASLFLFTPPFAVRYNSEGNLVAGITDANARLVYYDSDRDGEFDVADARTSGYNPDTFAALGGDVDGIYTLPFDQIETVIGVVTYSKKDLYEAGKNLNSTTSGRFPLNSNAAQWLLDPDGNPATDDGHGQVMFFSRYSGARLMR